MRRGSVEDPAFRRYLDDLQQVYAERGGDKEFLTGDLPRFMLRWLHWSVLGLELTSSQLDAAYTDADAFTARRGCFSDRRSPHRSCRRRRRRADGERTSLASSISRVSAVRLPQVRRPGQEGLRAKTNPDCR